MKILRVDLNHEKISFQDLEKGWESIGGSALIAGMLLRDAVNMATDPTTPSLQTILKLLEEIYE